MAGPELLLVGNDRNGQTRVAAWELAIAARLELLLGNWQVNGRGQTRVAAWELISSNSRLLGNWTLKMALGSVVLADGVARDG